VRTAENGWVFCRNNIRTPQAETVNLCIKAVAELGLDFGGVDCCETDFGTAVVFEVNTAPAIEGTTVRHYVDFFKEYLNG
jgi:glutathione synthase/RimK-type ligase-like ATP-grasp enzyme